MYSPSNLYKKKSQGTFTGEGGEWCLQQTNIGQEALFLEKRESGLANGTFGGSESFFWG